MIARRLSIRTKLTLISAFIFLLAFAGVIWGQYLLTRRSLTEHARRFNETQFLDVKTLPLTKPLYYDDQGKAVTVADLKSQITDEQRRSRDETLRTLVIETLVAGGLAGMLALGAGWFMASRLMRPLSTITNTARGVADRSLGERIHLEGPNDELKELADTFDDMLERLDRAFGSQQRFAANAAHELRTPLATSRTLIQVAMSRPGASEDLRTLGAALLEVNTQQRRLTDALLTLACGQQSPDNATAVDLPDCVSRAVDTVEAAAREGNISVTTLTTRALVWGEPVLLDQLVLNLVDNAVHHNGASGWVRVEAGVDSRGAWLTVTNSGPVVPDDKIDQIFEPFRRLTRDRTSDGRAGLGLSIARAITVAHGGEITARAVDGGGLHVCVRLPAVVPERESVDAARVAQPRSTNRRGHVTSADWGCCDDGRFHVRSG